MHLPTQSLLKNQHEPTSLIHSNMTASNYEISIILQSPPTARQHPEAAVAAVSAHLEIPTKFYEMDLGLLIYVANILKSVLGALSTIFESPHTEN